MIKKNKEIIKIKINNYLSNYEKFYNSEKKFNEQ